MNTVRWQVEEFETIDSTNRWLKERAAEGAPEGLVARADFQTSGRGRLDRRWEATPRSSLLVSVLLRPALDEEDLHLLTVAVALSAREALVHLSGLRPSLKWPNDLVVSDAKIGGILAEAVTDQNGALAVVVGLGLNLTSRGPLEAGGTSVLDETGITLSPMSVLDLLLDGLDARLAIIERGDTELVRHEFSLALSTLGRAVRVEHPLGTLQGTAIDVDRSGRLQVQTSSGLEIVDVGDVIHLRIVDNDS